MAQQNNSQNVQTKRRPKQTLTRIKTVWITEPTAPFIEDFEVGQQIGEAGQFGKAYRCRRKKDKKIFAVKAVSKARFYRLDRDGRQRNALLAAMQGEIDVMRLVKGQNPYIVNLESVYEDKHMLYIVMEECRGGELFDRIRARGQYTEHDAAKVLRQVCDALRYMHDMHNVVHCDLKPDNILFVSKKPNSKIKIIDFGMAKVLPRLRALRELCGTPYYTAPEIIEGHYAHGADMWSVGVIMFVMLFGFPPFYVDPNKYYGQAEAKAIYELIKKGFKPKVQKGYGPWFPKKIPVSREARDLMANLLTADRGKRLTAKETLNHVWVKNLGKPPKNNQKQAKKQQQNENNDENKNKNNNDNQNNNNNNNNNNQNDEKELVSGNVIEELTTFTNNCGLKLAVIRIFRNQFQKLRPNHFNEMKRIFEALDTDNDGFINYSDFEQGMLRISQFPLSAEQIKNMFKGLSSDGTQKIRFEDLLNAAIHDYLVASDERLYCAFRELDKDDDGSITVEELKKELKAKDPYGNYNEIINVLETNHLAQDGLINYEEFLRTLHPNFNETPKWFFDPKKQQQAPNQQAQQKNQQQQQQNGNAANAAANANGNKNANANANNDNGNANNNANANGDANANADSNNNAQAK